MARKSTRPGPKGGLRFGEVETGTTPLDIEQMKMASEREGVSLSLKYYRPETECFSAWSHADLKRFTSTVAKMRSMSVGMLRNHLALCERHRHKPKFDRFSRPDGLSKELTMFEIRVDGNNLARMHGVFIGSVFHLVWLDHKHQVFPI